MSASIWYYFKIWQFRISFQTGESLRPPYMDNWPYQEVGTSREFLRTLMRFKMVDMSGRRNLPFSPGKSYNLMWYLCRYLFKSIPFCEDKFKVYVCSGLLKYSTGHQNYKWQSVVSCNKLDTFHIMSTYPSFYLCLNDLVMHHDLSI